jgi:hypothetical protein
MEFLGQRIKDPSFLRIIARFLIAGYKDSGLLVESVNGVPQGGTLSAKKQEGGDNTFDFLGLTHYCTTSRHGGFMEGDNGFSAMWKNMSYGITMVRKLNIFRPHYRHYKNKSWTLFKQQQRGRPTEKTTFRKVETMTHRLSWCQKPARIQYDARYDGIFPLVTNRR